MFRLLAAAVLVAASLFVPSSSSVVQPGPVPAGVTITGVDSHDGMIYQDGGGYVWVGTKYGCGFQWQVPSTPWCGFGVWTAPAVIGPWTFVRNLFDETGTSGTWRNESWQTICRGDGCFNPRMHQRPDGVWVLWFNAPRDERVHGANQFWVMGCAGPTGPCGWGAGSNGSTVKPSLWVCSSGGDFSLLVDGANAYLVCGNVRDQHRIDIEKLQPWWADGTGVGATGLGGLSYVEGVGAARLPTGGYLLTAGRNCPYCDATNTAYAVASSPLGPYQLPAGRPERASISEHSCGGQPRTIITLDGQLYEQIDNWYNALNEASAATRLEPLIRTEGPLIGSVNGLPWRGGFEPFTCS